jgi:hypothetical protein
LTYGCVRSGKRILDLDASELEEVPIVAPDRGDSVLSHQGHEVRVRHEIASYGRPTGHLSDLDVFAEGMRHELLALPPEPAVA